MQFVLRSCFRSASSTTPAGIMPQADRLAGAGEEGCEPMGVGSGGGVRAPYFPSRRASVASSRLRVASASSGIVSARTVAAGSMGRSPHDKGFGEGCASIARASRLRGGVARRGGRVVGGPGERSVEFGHFGALLLELRLMRKGVAEAGLEARQPAGDFGDRAALLHKLHLEAPERRLQPGDEAERGHVLFAKDGVG